MNKKQITETLGRLMVLRSKVMQCTCKECFVKDYENDLARGILTLSELLEEKDGET